MTVYPQEKHACLQAARQRQTTAAFQRQYARRSGIEGAHAQGMRVADLRHEWYYGAKKVHVQHLATAAALDLLRMDAWLQGIPLARTRRSPLARFRKAASYVVQGISQQYQLPSLYPERYVKKIKK